MKYYHFEALGSTNDHLLKMAEGGAQEWTVVIADRQTSGRGRQGRDWWSPEGNLHMSILLRPEVSPRQLLRLPLIASLAFLSAMGESESSPHCKMAQRHPPQGEKNGRDSGRIEKRGG